MNIFNLRASRRTVAGIYFLVMLFCTLFSIVIGITLNGELFNLYCALFLLGLAIMSSFGAILFDLEVI